MLRTLTSGTSILAAAVLAAAPVITPSAAHAQDTPARVLAGAVAAFKAAETLRLEFEQSWSNPLTGRTGTSRGELLRRGADRFAVNFTDPAGDRIVSDGKVLWIYLPSSAPGQVVKAPAGGGGAFDPFSEVMLAPADRYAISGAGAAKVGGRATHAVTVVPKQGGAAFTRATVWIDDADASVRRVEATEPSGIVRRVTVTKATRNAKIPGSAFAFTPPAKARVIDRTR